MRNARAFVAEFAAAGFEQVGALRLSIGPANVIESLLLAPDNRSYAAVTDAIVHVTSLFPDGRGLVTRNSDHTRLPDYLLVNSAPGGSPSQPSRVTPGRWSSWRRAGITLSRSQHPSYPRSPLTANALPFEWAATHRRPAGEIEGSGPLWSRPERHEQIDAWHGYGAPESPA